MENLPKSHTKNSLGNIYTEEGVVAYDNANKTFENGCSRLKSFKESFSEGFTSNFRSTIKKRVVPGSKAK